MAHIHPAEVPPRSLGHEAEIETLSRLKKELSADYQVFHSIGWSWGKPAKTIFGEVDFVVINPAGHLLLIEQKSGGIDEIGDRWIKRYPDGEHDIGRQISG